MSGEIRAENLVWIFGTGRSGSTWLASMMGELIGDDFREKGYGLRFWNEPLVGQLLGTFYDQVPRRKLDDKHFIFGNTTREAYLEGIRYLILNVATSKFQSLSEDSYLVVKEPNGSVGAPLLMEALPESSMVLLVRDPRDVAASALDRHRKDAIAYQRRSKDTRGQKKAAISRADSQPDDFVRGQANRYLKNMAQAKRAYKAHGGRKALIRYEDLRTDTLGTMRRIHSTLDIPVSDEALVQAVEKHSWENIPSEQKGQGKDRRKATPGSWKEDLTPEQARIVEEITAPLLKQFYGRHET